MAPACRRRENLHRRVGRRGSSESPRPVALYTSVGSKIPEGVLGFTAEPASSRDGRARGQRTRTASLMRNAEP
jgi:hypothetical protein